MVGQRKQSTGIGRATAFGEALMAAYIFKRLLLMIPTLLGVLLLFVSRGM